MTRRVSGDPLARFVSLLSLLLVAASACAVDRAAQSEVRQRDEGAIVVGSFDFNESRALAWIYALGLKRAGYDVEVLDNVGSREVLEPALEQGHVDLVPEYQGSALRFLMLNRHIPAASPQTIHARLEQAFRRRGIAVLSFAGAENRNEVVVRGATAKKYDLEAIGDLEHIAGRLVFGGPPECPDRPLCLPGLKRVYELAFKSFQPLDASGPLTVNALAGGEVGVALLFTTDPAIRINRFVLLKDDRHLQPPENVVPVLRDEVLRRFGPRLVERIDSITKRLTTPGLREMNAAMVFERQSPQRVASDWLRAQGFGT